MNVNKVHKVLPALLICCCPLFSYAQGKVKVKASIDRNSILIGERIRLTYEADIPETQQIRFFRIDTIDHFEFIDRGKIDTINTSEGTFLKQELVITSFDSGQWVIPSYSLDLQKDIYTDSFVINVAFIPFDTSQAYHDIKEIIEVEPEKKEKKNWFYLAAAGLLFLIALLYVLLRKKKPMVVVQPEKDAYQLAMEQLGILRKIKDPVAKEYYTILVDIFRTYLAKRRNILSMQKTSDDLMIQLKPINIPRELFDRLVGVLRMADFVKFAKYQPPVPEFENSFNTISESIDVIEKIPDT